MEKWGIATDCIQGSYMPLRRAHLPNRGTRVSGLDPDVDGDASTGPGTPTATVKATTRAVHMHGHPQAMPAAFPEPPCSISIVFIVVFQIETVLRSQVLIEGPELSSSLLELTA